MNIVDKPSSPLADLFSRLVAFSLPVVYFLVTVSFYLKTYDSAQIKITLTQIGCSLVIFFWLAQLVLERRLPFKREDLPLLAPFLAFLGSGLLSFAQTSFRAGAVEETIRRLLFVSMGIIAISEFRGWDRHRRLLRWLLAAFAVVVLYGFIQFFDTRLFPPGQPGQVPTLDPFVWRHAFGLRPFSSFGNPNFYGNFLVIITPIVMALYLRGGGQIYRPYVMLPLMGFLVFAMDHIFTNTFGQMTAAMEGWWKASIILTVAVSVVFVWWRTPSAAASAMLLFWAALFVNLYATETKGAWVGFLAALTGTTVLVAFFFTGDNARRLVRRMSVMVLITVLVGATVIVYYARRRMSSVNFRVFTWIATWEMIRTQPFLGAGIGTFKWAYPAFRRPEIIIIEAKSNTETDHSEDEYLEVWHDEGALGFGIFLWIILTTSFLGVRALRTMTSQLSQGPPGMRHGERAFSILGYLGSYWGALAHWAMDVSIRFVSSGIYSLLLPALVVSLVRHDRMAVRQDAPSSLDFWLRLGIATFWLAVFLSLDIRTFPAFLCALAIWLLGEAFELRLTPEYTDGGAELSTVSLERGLRETPVWRLALLAPLLAAWVYCFKHFHGFFVADVNHNIAIFFSKSGVWAKSPEFDATVAQFPPEMQKEYETIGGAIEHYDVVVTKNPYFPMARYFIGNVYNDWGSTIYQQAVDAKDRLNDKAAADKLRARAEDMWAKALKTYDQVKAFAPNYVQTHHQVGLVYLKMGDMARAWGDNAKGNDYWDKALANFTLYNKLDPVFPPNYYRMAYIHFTRGDNAAAEKNYLDALTFNKSFSDRNAETYANLGRLKYIGLVNKYDKRSIDMDDPAYAKSEEYYLKGLAEAQKVWPPHGDRWGLDNLKGLGFLYLKAQNQAKANEVWNQLRQINPNDADVRNVFGLNAPAQ